MVKQIVLQRSNEIASKVDGINSVRISNIQTVGENSISAVEGADEYTSDKNASRIAIPIGIGLGVCAILAGIFLMMRSNRFRQREKHDNETISIPEHDSLKSSTITADVRRISDGANNYDLVSFPCTFGIHDEEKGEVETEEDITCQTPLDEGIEMELVERYLMRQPKSRYSFEKQKMSNENIQVDDTVEL